MSLEDIFVWCDGTWCYREELEEMNHMSDDYRILLFGTDVYDAFYSEYCSE